MLSDVIESKKIKEEDFKLGYKDIINKYLFIFVSTYPRILFTSLFFLFFSYIFGVLSCLSEDGISIIDFVDENNFIILTSFVIYLIPISFLVWFILSHIYNMRDLFLKDLSQNSPKWYSRVKLAGENRRSFRSKMSKNRKFQSIIFKDLSFSLLQLIIFIPYILKFIDIGDFIGLLIVVNITLIYISYLMKFYISSICFFYVPVFFMFFNYYVNYISVSEIFGDVLIVTFSIFTSLFWSYARISSLLLDAYAKNTDENYGQEIFLISVSVFPVWKYSVKIVLFILGVYHIKDATIRSINTHEKAPHDILDSYQRQFEKCNDIFFDLYKKTKYESDQDKKEIIQEILNESYVVFRELTLQINNPNKDYFELIMRELTDELTESNDGIPLEYKFNPHSLYKSVFVILETPNKIFYRHTKGPGPNMVHDRKIYYVARN